MGIDLVILLLCSITNLILGLGIWLRNYRSKTNRIFAALSIAIISWSCLNFVSDRATDETLAVWSTRLTLVGGMAILLSVYLLSKNFPRAKLEHGIIDRLQWPVAAIVLALTLSPLVVRSVMPTAEGANLQVGGLYALYVVYLLQGATLTIANFIRQYVRTDRQTEKSQIRLVLSGLIIYAIFTLTFSVVLPVIVDNWNSSRLGPLFSLAIVGVTAYAIVKHRLFDIRPIIARSIGYVFSVVFLAAIYGFVVFGLATLLIDLNIPITTQIILSLATGIAGLSFPRLRRRFDTTTKRIFYRDAYDPQELFDQLNKTLVSTIDLDRLLRQSSQTIVNNLHAGYCAVAVKDPNLGIRIIGTEKLSFSDVEITMARQVTPHIHHSVITADELGDTYGEFKAALVKNQIAALVRLTPNVRSTKEGLGYIILGPKKSGNPYTQQDIKVLDTIANELILAIQNALRYEEIQNFNATLQEQITEATRKLRRTNEKLKALDEAKDDFVSMASHQLRTPLTSIKGYTSMVLEGDAGKINATQRKLLEQSFTSSQRMVYLIADLLNVSRLKTGKFIIEEHATNLAEVVQQEIGQLKDVAAGRSLELTYDMPDSFPTLLLDETKTRQVIMNFVDNAIYYTPAGGHIKVELRETPASVEFRVVDDGIGVPKSEQPHLFTKFYRAGNARTARPDGTGLGLFMAKKVIVAQGGAILFNTEEGKGSTFGFVFSKTKAPAPVAEPKPVAARAKA